MYKDINIWAHFDLVNEFKIICKHCGENYTRNGSKKYLLHHLILKHVDKLTNGEKLVKFRYKILWKYFTKTNDGKFAKCSMCEKTLSFKTSVTNLKAHMTRSHPDVFLRELLNLPREKDNVEHDRTDSDTDEDSNDSGHQSSDVWNYFEQETGGRVRCILCRASRSNNTDDMRHHLAEKHPKLLQETGQVRRSSDPLIPNDFDNEDDGTYTEVIYLEEDVKKKPPKYFIKENKPRTLEPKKIKKIEKERRISVLSDEVPIKRKKQDNPDELDTFLTYIKCLLRQVPSEVCTKLQLDIVNLIMKAKLARGTITETIVLDHSTNAASEGNIDKTDVISVALADADIAPISESIDDCYEEVKDN